MRNEVVIEGSASEVSTLRYTPAGIPVIEFRLSHQSAQLEAGSSRDVQVQLSVIALADAALEAKAVMQGSRVVVKGFLARRGVKSYYPVLHAARIKIIQD